MICAVCEKPFARPSSRGPAPRFCSAACRQKAYRARHDVSQANKVELLADVMRGAIEQMDTVIGTLRETRHLIQTRLDDLAAPGEHER